MGMEVGDWITLCAVIVALSIGVVSILHTRSMQKTERKERLLNEIIDWAVDVCRCGLQPLLLPTRTDAKSKAGAELYLLKIFADLSLEYKSIYGRIEYVCKTSLSFGDNLKTMVDILAEIIENRNKLIDEQLLTLAGEGRFISSHMVKLEETDESKEWISSQDWPTYISNSFKVTMFEIMKNRTVLLYNAKQVIEEATKIKIKDIN